MVDQTLVDYIKTHLSKGFSIEQIRQTLISNGWSNNDINEAISLGIHNTASDGISPPYSKKTTKKSSILLIILVFAIIIIIGVVAFFTLSGKEPILGTGDSFGDELEIAPVYPGAVEVSTLSKVEETLLLHYPEAEIASYTSIDSPEEVQEWYQSELTYEGWQEAESTFQQWEKDGILLGVEIGTLSEEEAEEIGVEEGQTVIFLYRTSMPEP